MLQRRNVPRHATTVKGDLGAYFTKFSFAIHIVIRPGAACHSAQDLARKGKKTFASSTLTLSTSWIRWSRKDLGTTTN